MMNNKEESYQTHAIVSKSISFSHSNSSNILQIELPKPINRYEVIYISFSGSAIYSGGTSNPTTSYIRLSLDGTTILGVHASYEDYSTPMSISNYSNLDYTSTSSYLTFTGFGNYFWSLSGTLTITGRLK